MLLPPRHLIAPIALSLLVLAGCANSPNADSIGQALKADPRLNSPSPSPSPSVSPTPSPSPTPSTSPTPEVPPSFTDLDKVPAQLQPYIRDLLALNVLSLKIDRAEPAASPQNSGSKAEAKPDSKPESQSDTGSPSKADRAPQPSDTSLLKIITRREYARWLVAVNNRLFSDRPAKQIRLAAPTNQLAFQDVPSDDPDFPSIQGLAEAGLIPSALSGNSNANLFRPNAPLTREDLIVWKVPIDTRNPLPTATIESIKQTWGFQDASKIDPKALRAIYMDFQNADQSNIRRAFGYTTLFQPQRPVTRAEAIAVLWYFGFQGDGVSARDALNAGPTPSPKPSTTP